MQATINYGQDEGKIKSAVPDLMQHLSDDRLVALSMSGFGHRLTHGIAGDILARGWSTEGQTDEFDDALNVRAKFEAALAAERLFGGSHLLMVCDDTDDLSQPLPPEPVDVLALHLLIPRDARPRSREQDLRSPRWSLPDVWDVQPQRQGMHTRGTQVHASRLLTFPGLRIPPGIVAPRDGYGLPVLDVYWPAIRAIELVLEGMVYAGIEYSTAWVRLKQSLAAVSASDNDQPTLEDRMRLYRDSASMARVRLLLGDDETGRDSVNLTGLRTEVLMAQYERVPTVEGLPLTAAIGMSPSGMSTDDASGARTYHRFIRAQRDNRLSPLLRQLHRAQFGETIPHEWEPIEESDPLASAALVQAGIADPDELRERHGLPQRAVEMEPTAAEEAAALAALAALVTPAATTPAAP